MEIEEFAALATAIIGTLMYTFLLLKNFAPFIIHLHKMSRLKEHGNLVSAEAEIVDIETRNVDGFKFELIKLYVMRVRYNSENTARGVEHSDMLFAKKPPERAGQKIKVLYSREDPGVVMTPDSHETVGAFCLFVKLVFSIAAVFGVIFVVIYGLGSSGMLDD